MKIKKYRPAFFSGFEEETYEVSSKEELMDCELIKSALQCGGEVCFSYSEDTSSHIMLVIENADKGEGCEWWVVSIINNKEDAIIIRGWLPDWDEVIKKYEKKT